MYKHVDLVRQGSILDFARWRYIDVATLYIIEILWLLFSFVWIPSEPPLIVGFGTRLAICKSMQPDGEEMCLCKWTWGYSQWKQGSWMAKGTSVLNSVRYERINSLIWLTTMLWYWRYQQAFRCNEESVDFIEHTHKLVQWRFDYVIGMMLSSILFPIFWKLAFIICAIVTRWCIYAFLHFACCTRGQCLYCASGDSQ